MNRQTILVLAVFIGIVVAISIIHVINREKNKNPDLSQYETKVIDGKTPGYLEEYETDKAPDIRSENETPTPEKDNPWEWVDSLNNIFEDWYGAP